MVPDLPANGTDKLGKVMDVYENAWAALMNLCTRLHAAGIGCLVSSIHCLTLMPQKVANIS